MNFQGIASLATQKSDKPSNTASARYLFFTMGIDQKGFDNCSIPYILEILRTHHYVKEEEEKANKKASR